MKPPSNDKAASGKLGIAHDRLRRASPGDTPSIPTEEHHVSEDAKRPTPLRADIMPRDGFILTIDGKMKARYETEAEATAAGSALKQQFPVIQVSVYDAAGQVHTPVKEPAA